MNSSNLEFTAKYETAKDKIKLTIDDKKKKVNILLGNRQFLNINDWNMLTQRYVDIFYTNTLEFMQALNNFLKAHQFYTKQLVDDEMMMSKFYQLIWKKWSWIKKLNRFLGEKSFRSDIDEISLWYALIMRILSEVDTIISFYEMNKNTTKAKWIPELLELLKDMRYSFLNILRSQRNYHNTICSRWEENLWIAIEKMSGLI
ncbi:MAG: hypothetical protein ACD_2C00256G0004 [uncultured bacterium (gcode 4)]|uniref:Uncharacterized protein n=1 Tax=uncultured bacterium (gcode 4) TaxID=1234023 RepID=K2G3U8_9BACT|nr:MAG: hypothetical protein ACD_2C00256G0004 [uncultured bacterium (gcode 4)]